MRPHNIALRKVISLGASVAEKVIVPIEVARVLHGASTGNEAVNYAAQDIEITLGRFAGPLASMRAYPAQTANA